MIPVDLDRLSSILDNMCWIRHSEHFFHFRTFLTAMLVKLLCRWLYDSDSFKMLVTESITSIKNLSPKHLVSDTRHQHRRRKYWDEDGTSYLCQPTEPCSKAMRIVWYSTKIPYKIYIKDNSLNCCICQKLILYYFYSLKLDASWYDI